MVELKTRPTDDDVAAFIAAIPDETRRTDTRTVVDLMREVTGEAPRLWGPGMIGFGSYHYRHTAALYAPAE